MSYTLVQAGPSMLIPFKYSELLVFSASSAYMLWGNTI